MRKSYFTYFLLGYLLLACKATEKTAKSTLIKAPNIILIMADDLGMETLGCYGSEEYQTPNLDKMAAQGMQFTQCYSTPLCTPSRVQLMTGKYNFRNYIGFGLLDPEEKTFGHLLQEAGYSTCVVGKWQLYGNEYQQKLAGGRVGSLPEEAGFDDWCLWQVKERRTRYKSPTLTLKGKGTTTFPDAYGPDLFVDHIESFMQSHKDSAFFIYYPMALTHDPFQPTPNNPEFRGFDPEIHPKNDTIWFDDMVSYMDKLVGRIVFKTEELGIAENTLILFIGDNGTDRDVSSGWNGQNIMGNKGYPVKWGTHVPFISYWPGHIQPGQVNHNLIDFTDFLPSMMDVTQAKIPDDFFVDGLSFYPQLLGRETEVREWIFCHYAPNWGKFKPVRYAQDKAWKLYEDGRFFHYQTDLTEEKPLNLNRFTTAEKAAYDKLQKILENMKKQTE